METCHRVALNYSKMSSRDKSLAFELHSWPFGLCVRRRFAGKAYPWDHRLTFAIQITLESVEKATGTIPRQTNTKSADCDMLAALGCWMVEKELNSRN